MILPLTYRSQAGPTLTIDLHRTFAIIPRNDCTAIGTGYCLEFHPPSGHPSGPILQTDRTVDLKEADLKRFLRYVWESAELEDDYDVIVDQWQANEAAREKEDVKKAERKKVSEIIEGS